MADEERAVSDALDPSRFAAHVVRTGLLIEQLARDVKYLRDQFEASSRSNETTRSSVSSQEREVAVFKATTTSEIAALKDAIDDIVEKQRWLSRLVMGALITGLISGVLALVWKAVG